MKAKHIFFIVFIILALGLVAASILRSAFFVSEKGEAGGFGIAPPQIILENMQGGDEAQAEMMLLRSDGNSVQQISAELGPSEVASWITINPGSNILFSAGKTKQVVRFNIKIPDNTLPGSYEGSVLFRVFPSAHTSGAAISLGAKALIKITIVPGISEHKTLEIVDTLMYENYRGQVIIKTEDNFQAYYLSPAIPTAYFLEELSDAQNIISEFGTGIANQHLNLIPIGFEPLVGDDTDGDRLADLLEDAIGTDKFSRDSDRDLFNDYAELVNGYNPRGEGALTLDLTFSAKQAGKIFLQVESRGEAWYINPGDNKRYFLGSPEDTLFVLRQLGAEITNRDFDRLIKQ